MSLLTTSLIWIPIAAIIAALAYALLARRRPGAPPAELTYMPGRAADPARAVFAAADGEPPTEDQIARARLGGPRGAPELGEAPLARQAREQTPRKFDDGHVA